MKTQGQWLYYNIHDLVKMRLQAGSMSVKAFDFYFGPFKTQHIDEDKIDVSVQDDVKAPATYSYASGLYCFGTEHLYLNEFKTRLCKQDGMWILAGKRNLLPFINPVLQMLFLEKNHCVIHSASVAVNGRGVLLPAWGGTGKTSAIMCVLKEMAGSSFLSDDFSFISGDTVYSDPKAFFIYPYHRKLFPHLFKKKHKLLIPSFCSGLFEKMRIFLRPTIMMFPRLENFIRNITPEHMQVPARDALGDVEFSDKAGIDTMLFLERYHGDEVVLEDVSLAQIKSRLIGNWLHEIGKCSQEMIVAMGGTGIIDLSEYYGKMAEIIESACENRTVKLLKMPTMTPQKTGKIITEKIKEIMNIG